MVLFFADHEITEIMLEVALNTIHPLLTYAHNFVTKKMFLYDCFLNFFRYNKIYFQTSVFASVERYYDPLINRFMYYEIHSKPLGCCWEKILQILTIKISKVMWLLAVPRWGKVLQNMVKFCSVVLKKMNLSSHRVSIM